MPVVCRSFLSAYAFDLHVVFTDILMKKSVRAGDVAIKIVVVVVVVSMVIVVISLCVLCWIALTDTETENVTGTTTEMSRVERVVIRNDRGGRYADEDLMNNNMEEVESTCIESLVNGVQNSSRHEKQK